MSLHNIFIQLKLERTRSFKLDFFSQDLHFVKQMAKHVGANEVNVHLDQYYSFCM